MKYRIAQDWWQLEQVCIQEAVWSFSVSVFSGSTRRATEEQLVWFCWSPAGYRHYLLIMSAILMWGLKERDITEILLSWADVCAYRNENMVLKLAPSEDLSFLSLQLAKKCIIGVWSRLLFSPLYCLHKAQHLSQLHLFSMCSSFSTLGEIWTTVHLICFSHNMFSQGKYWFVKPEGFNTDAFLSQWKFC